MLINILTVVIFLLMFSVLVSVHELGHYLAARMYGMSVSEFAIGMGKKVKTFGRRKYIDDKGDEQVTEFNIRLFPLGGFVKILGMEHDSATGEAPVAGEFYSKHPWKRVVVLLAGPVFSLVFGWIILTGVFSISGEVRGVNVVAETLADSPAAKAGIVSGDRILSIDGKTVTSNVDGVKIIRDSNGKTLSFAVQRSGKDLTIPVTPTLSKEERQVLDEDGIPTGEFKHLPQVGIMFGEERFHPSLIESMGLATKYPIDQVRLMVKKITKPKVLIDNSTGVVGMAVITKAAVESGISTVFLMTGLISLSLGIFNLFPIYPLDGGQIVISLIEWMRKGKQVSMSVKGGLLIAGLSIMVCLFIFRFYKDMVQYVLPGKENVITGPGKPSKDAPAPNANNAPDR